ncbi:MAG: sugar transferase [Bacteroidota bacterium]
MKRIFDVCVSGCAVMILSPLLVLIWLCVRLTSAGPGIFTQLRVGKHNTEFRLYKFRTMYTRTYAGSAITVGSRDPRITPLGYVLRKYKVDEWPQLINVLKGDMSFVGPRPEVRKYVDMYNAEQIQVLNVRPGITDYASLLFINENELLGRSADPEYDYIHTIMPQKLKLNLEYIENQSFLGDIRLIFRTLFRIVGILK